ncbi:MAG: cob(I)yrinic acid a,c-diamide adenosyltransferase [Candidatus Bathyarchaeota archaeon]|nr:cob(I)yrinic acid a,c-diamide adenosyltransferase [Candidatus Bathyarchaeota archaeon]
MGYVYLYTGTGGGKTANALGLALRTVGHRKKAVIIQFFKWRKDTGEYKIKERLGELYEIYQFGREAWLGRETRTEKFGGETFQVEGVTDRDRELAEAGLAFAGRVMQEQKPALLVLDEVNLAVHWGLLRAGRVLELLRAVPAETTVVLTGRYAPQELLDRAEFVNIVQDVKMPDKFEPVEGIQY